MGLIIIYVYISVILNRIAIIQSESFKTKKDKIYNLNHVVPNWIKNNKNISRIIKF